MRLGAVLSRGDLPESLKALRDFLADRIEGAGSRDVAPIGHLLVEIMAKIEDMAPAKTTSPVDELAKQREQRRAAG